MGTYIWFQKSRIFYCNIHFWITLHDSKNAFRGNVITWIFIHLPLLSDIKKYVERKRTNHDWDFELMHQSQTRNWKKFPKSLESLIICMMKDLKLDYLANSVIEHSETNDTWLSIILETIGKFVQFWLSKDGIIPMFFFHRAANQKLPHRCEVCGKGFKVIRDLDRHHARPNTKYLHSEEYLSLKHVCPEDGCCRRWVDQF